MKVKHKDRLRYHDNGESKIVVQVHHSKNIMTHKSLSTTWPWMEKAINQILPMNPPTLIK